jgi:hypothetical protein
MGSGNVSSFIVVMKSAVQMDAYTGMYVLVDNASDVQTYSEAYDDIVTPVMNDLESLAPEREEIRYNEIVGEAEETLNEHKDELSQAKDDLADAQATAMRSSARRGGTGGFQTEHRGRYEELQASEDRLEQEKADGLRTDRQRVRRTGQRPGGA